jgi:hypothetical protein
VIEWRKTPLFRWLKVFGESVHAEDVYDPRDAHSIHCSQEHEWHRNPLPKVSRRHGPASVEPMARHESATTFLRAGLAGQSALQRLDRRSAGLIQLNRE